MRLPLLAALAAAIFLPAEPSFGQFSDQVYRVLCQDAEHIAKALEKKYSEVPRYGGVTNNNTWMELLTSDNGETWTLIVKLEDGTACMIGAGQNWREVEPESADPKA